MGKYTLVATNQLGHAECSCDLIVRKKQFPPVFWKRLYNVYGDDNSKFVGEVEIGGWPVPDVYWYKVTEDGEEIEVTTKSHTENWNGNPNKYVPESKIEVRQLDQIRHVIIFHHASNSDSGLYRVRAVNALGEAECEADLDFDGCSTGEDLYLPPGWQDKKRLTWKDEDNRKKLFVGHQEPELTPEELADMRKKCGGVPLSRVWEYLASLPDYVPSDNFRQMDRMPFKPGVDEHDYRPGKKGGKSSYPSVFKKGDIKHFGYNSDMSGRILPIWRNSQNPNSKDSSDFRWRPVHPDLYVPEIPQRCECPDPPPIWESEEDIKNLIAWLHSLGCNVNATEIRQDKTKKSKKASNSSRTNIEQAMQAQPASKKDSKVDKFSYLVPRDSEKADTHAAQSARSKRVQESSARKMWEDKLNANATGAASNATDFTRQFMQEMYERDSVQEATQQQYQVSQQHQQKVSQENQQQASQQYQHQASKEYQQQASQQYQQLASQQYQQQAAQQYQQEVSQQYQQEASQQYQQEVSQQYNQEVSEHHHQVSQHHHHQRENNEQQQMSHHHQIDPPALPPKTKIMNSPSRSLFSPTESIESNGYGTATVKTVEFMPVKEKVKLIAAQQEELMRKEETEGSGASEKKKGVRILPPSPVTVRKMSVDDELYHYDEVVKRSTPVTQVLEKHAAATNLMVKESSESRRDYSSFDSAISKSMQSEYSSSSHYEQKYEQQSSQQQVVSKSTSSNWEADSVLSDKKAQQNMLEQFAKEKELPRALDQLIADNESVTSSSGTFQTDSTMNQQFQHYTATSSAVQTSSDLQISAASSNMYQSTAQSSKIMKETPAEECRRSFEQAELEAMALDSETSRSFSKQSSVVETCSTQSFVIQDQQSHESSRINKSESYARNLDQNSRKPVSKSNSFARKPDNFSPAESVASFSVPNTPMSGRRRLRINQSPKPPAEKEEQQPK